MRNNIIALPAGRPANRLPVVRAIDDQDLFIKMLEFDPRLEDWRQGRDDRRDDYYDAVQSKREEDEKLLQNVSTTAMFATLAALIGFGLGF